MYKASVRKTGFEFDKPPTLDGKFVRFHAERTDSLLRLPFVRPVYKEGNGGNLSYTFRAPSRRCRVGGLFSPLQRCSMSRIL